VSSVARASNELIRDILTWDMTSSSTNLDARFVRLRLKRVHTATVIFLTMEPTRVGAGQRCVNAAEA
jgi:hypothetical protein